jgi:hypothetical protein
VSDVNFRYGTVILVRHKVSGRLFAQKQLKKASLVVQTNSKIVGMTLIFLALTVRIYQIGKDYIGRSQKSVCRQIILRISRF